MCRLSVMASKGENNYIKKMKLTRSLRFINNQALELLKNKMRLKVNEAPQDLSKLADRIELPPKMNSQTLETLKSKIKTTVAEAPHFLDKLKEEKKKTLYEKLVSLNKWYIKIIGLDEVKLCQDKVTALQDRLLKTQEKRREVGRQLATIRERSLELQDEIHKVKRQENLSKFLDLMKQETEILQLEKSISRTFQDYDQAERELFTAFTNAIRDSHEKQRAQLEYTKYFGIILSITGSLLAFMFTSIRKNDLKRFIEQKLTEPGFVQGDEKIKMEAAKNKEALDQVVSLLILQSLANKRDENGLQNLANKHDEYGLQLLQRNTYNIDWIKVTVGVSLAYIFVAFLASR